MLHTDMFRSLENYAQSDGVKTSFTISPNILQDILEESYQVKDIAEHLLESPDDSLDWIVFMEEKGTTEEQCKLFIRKQLAKSLEQIEQIKQIQEMGNTLPTYDFVNYLIKLYLNTAHAQNIAAERIEQLKTTIKRQKFILVGLVIFGLFTGTVLFSSSLSSSSVSPPISNSTSYADDAADKDAHLTLLPYPESGEPLYNYCDPSERVAPLTIETSGYDAYCVKLVSRHNPNYYVSFFIRPGETAEYLMPLGDFELRYASGDEWYGLHYLFGSDTVYSKASDILSFTFDGEYYTGHTITLYPVSNGNMSTEIISEDDF